MNILENFYSPAVLVTDYAFSESGIYKQLDAAETDHKVHRGKCVLCGSKLDILLSQPLVFHAFAFVHTFL